MSKVLQVGATNILGGIETYLHNYYKNIDHNRVNFDFVNMYDKIYFQEEYEETGAQIYKLPNYRKHPIKYIKKLKQILINGNYDVLHFNMNSAVFLYPLIAAKIAGTKIVIAHAHNASNDKGILKTVLHNINKHFIPIFSNRYVACSEKAGEWFFSKNIRKSNNYHIINNSVDVDKFKFDINSRIKLRRELKVNDNTLVIGHVGRFNKQKNHYFMINIAKELRKANLDFKLLLIGTGPMKQEIENKVREDNLENNIILLGQKLNVNEFMSAMDIFILPSIYEGLPIVAIEAQAAGLQCVLSSNITTEVVDTENVTFLDINSIEEWCNCILKMKENNVLDRKVKIKKFNIKYTIDELLKIYEIDVKVVSNGRNSK